MKRVLRHIIYATIIVAAGCAAPQFFRLQGPPAHPVTLKSVTFEREIRNNDWKSLVDVAADRTGNIYVLDGSTHQVFVADPQGKPLIRIGETGFWKKTFPRPSSIAVDDEGRIFVADSKDNSIKVFDRTGAFSMKIGQKGTEPGNFRCPTGIDVDAARNIYVVDQQNMRVQKFDPRGVFVTQIASGPKPIAKIDISGTGGPIKFIAWPQFKQIRDIAVGPYGIMYLLDEGLCVVHAYSLEGAYLFSFGGRGRRSGNFEKPAGIAVGAMGVVCVSDEKKNNIQLFDPEGRFLMSLGGRGKANGQFTQPQGIGASAEGKILVADKGNRRVQVFTYAVPTRAVAPVAKLDKPVRIAIFDFKNNNPQAQARGYGEAISEMFLTAFATRPNFEVIERKQLRKVLDEVYLDQSGVVEAETAKKVGKVLGVDIALAGGVAAFAGSIQSDVRLLDVETGKVILADSIEANSEGQLRSLVNAEVLKLENSYIVRFYAPFPPAGIMGDGGVRECSLSWKASEEPDFKEYLIYKAASQDGPYTLVAKTSKTEWADRNLPDGAEYYYRLAAVDTTGLESKQCEAFSVKTRGKPSLGQMPIRENVTVKKSSFSWTENENDVTGYVIYGSSAADGTFTRVGESRTSKFSEGGLGDGETRYYKVAKKFRNGLESESSKPFAVRTKPRPAAPGGLSAQGGLARRVSLTWADPKEKDIREFRVFRADKEDGEYKKVATVTPGWLSSPSYEDGKLLDKTAYYYKVQSVDKDNLESPMSAPATATTKPLPSAPRGLAAEGGMARAVRLAWEKNPESDIKKYYIATAAREGGSFSELTQTSETSFTHTGLKDLTAYYYKIRALDRDGLMSDFTQVVSATTKPRPAQPLNLTAEGGLVKSVRLAWAANPEKDIDHYTVSRGTGQKGNFKQAGTAKANSYTDKGIGDGATCRYVIAAVDADGLVSDESAPAEATTKPRPAAPAGVTAEVQSGKIVLTWKANTETDITGYEIFRSTAWDILGGETRLGQVTGLSFEDCTAKAGKNYTYRITAFDGAGLHSEKSKSASAHLP